MPYSIVNTETKNIEIILRGADRESEKGRIDKKDLDGLYDRIVMDFAQNQDYSTIKLDFDKITETDPRIIFLIKDFQKYASENNKKFIVTNAYGKVAETLDAFNTKYRNEF